MIFILTKSVDAAKQLAQANDILPKDWRFVYDANSMYGYKNQVLWLGYGYKKHLHSEEALRVAVERCFRVFSVQEVPKYTLSREEKT